MTARLGLGCDLHGCAAGKCGSTLKRDRTQPSSCIGRIMMIYVGNKYEEM